MLALHPGSGSAHHPLCPPRGTSWPALSQPIGCPRLQVPQSCGDPPTRSPSALHGPAPQALAGWGGPSRIGAHGPHWHDEPLSPQPSLLGTGTVPATQPPGENKKPPRSCPVGDPSQHPCERLHPSSSALSAYTHVLLTPSGRQGRGHNGGVPPPPPPRRTTQPPGPPTPRPGSAGSAFSLFRETRMD